MPASSKVSFTKLAKPTTRPISNGADPEWPLWYADYLWERLGGLLDASFVKSELVHMLVLVSGEHPLKAPGANWARYNAGFFITRYT